MKGMTHWGWHASHEQISPQRLLRDAHHAEQAGFERAMCSEHVAPWSERQGHSGNAFVWLGAALATTDLTFGCVSAPGQRHHPAVHAHAIATLGAMFPGRFWVALASGEAMNEHITGDPWPRKEIREQRLDECAGIIRRLLHGEEVSHDGLVTVDRARLYDLPDPTPLLIAPAVTARSAARVAAWADGLVTLNQPHDRLREVLEAYRSAGGRGKVSLQVHLSWAPTDAEAEVLAHDQWRTNVFAEPVPWDTELPEAFDAMAEHVPPEVVREHVRVSADLAQHTEWLQEYAALGFDDIYLHHVGQEQRPFLDAFAETVLPDLKEN